MTTHFEDFEMRPELMQAINALGFTEPTPIQAGIIPLMMQGIDVTGQAQTGTGKTAAFALPILNNLKQSEHYPQALIIAPTRELALQITEMTRALGQFCEVSVLTVYGGTAYGPQLNQLRHGVQIVVGTPGRVLDLIKRDKINLSGVRTVVLDEADEMLSMGFIEDIEAILRATPTERQTTLFSATLPPRVRELARKYLSNPQTVAIEAKQMTVAATEQRFYLVNEQDKLALLTRVIEMEDISSALVFTRTRVRTGELVNELNMRGYPAEALSGDLSQEAREHTMTRFRSGLVKVLVATDVAARGLDVEGISHVFNFDLPEETETYVHRVGRTGRAGNSGIAISFVRPSERRHLRQIEQFTHQEIQEFKVPTPEEIRAKRMDSLLSKIDMWLKRNRVKEERALVESMIASGIDPLDLAAVAIKIARAEEKQRPIAEISPIQVRPAFTENRNRRESGLRHRNNFKGKPRAAKKPGRHSEEQGMIRLEMNLGRSHGIRPGDIVASIAGIADIPGDALGKIHIQDQHSLVDVSEQYLEKIVQANHRLKVKGQAFKLTKN